MTGDERTFSQTPVGQTIVVCGLPGCAAAASRRRLYIFAALFFLLQSLHAQDLTEGKQLYDVQCQVCHGEDAHGSDRAPE